MLSYYFFNWQSSVCILGNFPLHLAVFRGPTGIFFFICCIVVLYSPKITVMYLSNSNIYCLLMKLKSSMPYIPLTVAFSCSLILNIHSTAVLLTVLNKESTAVLLTTEHIEYCCTADCTEQIEYCCTVDYWTYRVLLYCWLYLTNRVLLYCWLYWTYRVLLYCW